MANRHREALEIQEGAVNVAAIARALVRAADEVHGEKTSTPSRDAAVRLIVHQLASLCRVSEMDDDLNVYGDLSDECRKIDDERRTRERFALTVANYCGAADGD